VRPLDPTLIEQIREADFFAKNVDHAAGSFHIALLGAVAAMVVSRIFALLVGGPLRLSDHGVALPEQLHIQISFGRPAGAGDVA
jgi:hypothetical protein